MTNTTKLIEQPPLLHGCVCSPNETRLMGIFVSRCLETGHVVTTDSAATAAEMMLELLQDEIAFAVEHKNFPNLFSNPASFDVWLRYQTLANRNPPERKTYAIDARELRLEDDQEVSTEDPIRKWQLN